MTDCYQGNLPSRKSWGLVPSGPGASQVLNLVFQRIWAEKGSWISCFPSPPLSPHGPEVEEGSSLAVRERLSLLGVSSLNIN